MSEIDAFREKSAALAGESAGGPKGLGGWLVLVGLGLVSSILIGILEGLNFADNVDLANRLGGAQGGVLVAETIGNLLTLVFYAVATLLFLQKSRHFPGVFIVLTIANAIYIFADLIAVWTFFRLYFTAENPFWSRDTIRSVGRAIVGICLWVPYMLMSVRVKNTFVN